MKRMALLVSMLLLTSCTTMVNLTVRNPTVVAQSPRLVVTTDKGLDSETVMLGTLAPTKQTQRSIEVKEGYRIEVKSSTSAGGYGYDVGWTSGVYTIPKEPDPFDVDIDLGIAGNTMLNDSEGIAKIRDALSDLGPNVGFKPLDVRNALGTWFGALVVFVPPTEDKPEKILHAIQPLKFCGGAITYDNFNYPSTLSSSDAKVIGKSSANLAVSVPVYGSIGVNTAADNVYEVRWNMNGFGMVTKKDPANWSLGGAIASLDDVDKATICEAFGKNPTAEMLYVNRFYVIKNADFYVKESRKMSVGATLAAASVLTADGAWTFEGVQERHRQFQELVLNIGCITVPAKIVCDRGTYQLVLEPSMVQEEHFLSAVSGVRSPERK